MFRIIKIRFIAHIHRISSLLDNSAIDRSFKLAAAVFSLRPVTCFNKSKENIEFAKVFNPMNKDFRFQLAICANEIMNTIKFTNTPASPIDNF